MNIQNLLGLAIVLLLLFLGHSNTFAIESIRFRGIEQIDNKLPLLDSWVTLLSG